MNRVFSLLALCGLLFWQPVNAIPETVKYTALSAVTTGTSVVYALNNKDTVGLQVAWASGVTAGVIVVETAPTQDYAGTWETQITLNVTTAGTPPCVQSEAVRIAGAFARVRVTTTVSGGGAPSATAYIMLQDSSR